MKPYMQLTKLVVAVVVCIGLLTALGCSGGGATALSYNESIAEDIRDEFIVGTGSSSQAESLPDPTGWQTITGRFVVNSKDSVASFPSMSTAKDRNCGVQSLPSEVVVIGANNGIQNVMLYVDSALGSNDPGSIWVHESYGEKKPVELDQYDCRFLTHVFAVRTNQTLMLKNGDRTTHNVNIKPSRGIASNKSYPAGAAAEPYVPTAQENRPFPVVCDIHPWMKAWMIVRDNPYFAVSGNDGGFTIGNVPAGVELSYRIWTEPKFYSGTVTVKEGSEEREVEVKNGKFSLALQPRENDSDPAHDITFVLDGAVLGK